jgi:predicted ferric reductase
MSTSLPPRSPETAPEAGPAAGARRGRGVAWVTAYLLLVAFPLFLLWHGRTTGGGWTWDFSLALGLGGLAILVLQFALTARFRRATAPFGIDIIYYFHRWAAISGAGLILAHYLILKLWYPEALGAADPREAAFAMTAGRASLALFGVLIVTSVARRLLRLEYDRWRIWHGVMAVAAVVLAGAHVVGAGHFTADPWRRMAWTGYSAVWLLLLAYIRIVKPWRLQRRPYRVTAVQPERGRAWTLTLAPLGGAMPAFRPGQFAWLTIGGSPFRAREHPFSFSGSAARAPELQFTIKALGDFTRTIGRTPVGTIAYVDGPHGVFTPDDQDSAPCFVFIAGGVGIAPIMSMLRTFADRGERRPVLLIDGSRRWEDVMFREEIESLRGRLNLRVVYVLQEPAADRPGPTGLLTESVLRSSIPAAFAPAEYYLCGPRAMSDSVQRTLRGLGVPLHRIHCELFDMV